MTGAEARGDEGDNPPGTVFSSVTFASFRVFLIFKNLGELSFPISDCGAIAVLTCGLVLDCIPLAGGNSCLGGKRGPAFGVDEAGHPEIFCWELFGAGVPSFGKSN
jgi:hypothetical protein